MDGFQTLGDYIAAELRKVPDPSTAAEIEHKLLHTLQVALDEIDWPVSASTEKQASSSDDDCIICHVDIEAAVNVDVDSD
ncbi:hypothetical protein quinque_000692 [Culex quinquefasciatus]